MCINTFILKNRKREWKAKVDYRTNRTEKGMEKQTKRKNMTKGDKRKKNQRPELHYFSDLDLRGNGPSDVSNI